MPRGLPKVAAAQRASRVEALKTQIRAWLSRVLRRPWNVFQRICFGIGLGVLFGLFAGVGYLSIFLRSLPDVQRLSFDDLQDLGRQVVHQRLDNKKARYEWVPLRQVSREFLYSIVVSEDATFFEHDGINLEMVLSSFAENLKEGKAAYGASTISQQLVKNLFLTSEKTYVRKVKEFLVTKRLEKAFKKNEILELYLNIAEFGPDIYGVGAASKHYFDTTPDQINAAQGAFMALMLPSPKRNYFSIFQNHNLTKVKQRRLERVLRDMLYEEYLSEAQYRKYVKYRYFPETSPRSPARSR